MTYVSMYALSVLMSIHISFGHGASDREIKTTSCQLNGPIEPLPAACCGHCAISAIKIVANAAKDASD
jgi:hypothetical protein